MGQVDGQDRNRRPAHRGPTDQNRTIPAKVTPPLLTSRVVQPDSFAGPWINTSQVRPFVMIASKAGQSEVGQDSSAAMLLSDNVVDLVDCRRKRLGEPGVLAAVVRPAPDRNIETFRHMSGSTGGSASLERSPSLGVQDVEQTSELLEGVDLQLLWRSETAGSSPGG